MRRLAPLAPLAVLVLLLTGCSVGVPNGSVVSATPSEVVGKPPKAPTVKADPAAGKVVFTTVGCSACHTFTPAGSSSHVGPDLDNLAEYAKAANQGTLAEFVKNSILDPNGYVEHGFQPGVMPPNYGQSLKPQQIDDLVAFLTQGT